MRIALSRDATVSNDGHVYVGAQTDAGVTWPELTLPSTLKGLSTPPCMRVYNKRLYIAGAFTAPAVVLENFEIVQAGIPAPAHGPTVVPGTGSGGSSGVAICAVRFGQRVGTTIIAVGEPSEYADAITLTGQGRSWSNLPTTSTNPRVNIIQGLVSMGGEPAAVAWTRVLGTTAVVENVLTGALGELIPVKNLANGLVAVDRGALGVPPSTTMIEVYHDRMWYAGDPLHPERIYPSALFNPEGVNTDPENGTWLETKDGLPVTGLHVWKDQLIVGTPRSLQRVQGYGPDDFSIEVISTYTGVLSNQSMITFGPQGDMLFAGQDGINLYDGGIPRNLMRSTLRYYWRDDFTTYTANYEKCQMAYSRFFDVFMLMIPQDDTTMFRYVGTLEPLLRGEPPDWSFDVRSRNDSALGQFILPDSDYGYGLYTGSCDGYIRAEDDLTNADDDGDLYNKQFTLQTGALFADDDQCGDDAHGARWTDLNLFVANPHTALTVSLFGGDETSSDSAAPQFTDTLAASASATEVNKTSFDLGTLVTIAGKSVTLKIVGEGSTDFSFRGWAVAYTQGAQTRPNYT